MPPPRLTPPRLADGERLRFWSLVDERGPDDCWPWTAMRSSAGYGSFATRDGNLTATRIAYYLSAGKWPGRMCVLHACDNPPCCNPAHLFLGTVADNSADMSKKGRGRNGGRRGEKNARARLTEDDVLEIRRAFAWGETNVSIAARYGVTHSMISAIRRGKAWAHVEEEAA